jgi:serine phosphatase RsbU (regulator of sigma subunit)
MAQREFVDAQNKQLALAVKDIETAYNLVEEQNMRMTDSIRYAQKIQNALLTNERRLSRVFPENFVMYRAKDIVSGDFYWAAKTQKFRFAAVVDCTGHGVPGAFMSVIGNNFLNQIVFNENHLEPSAILESLNEKVVHALKQDENENNDGMHLALIRVEEKAPEHFEILFAGAKRPLYYSYKNEVCTLKGSRKDIGGAQNDEIRFENHLLEISSTETLYLTSDGFADQNNEARQKISSKKLVELLQKNTALPLREQKVRLENFFDNFRGEEPQRDDVTVIGIRI